MLDHAWGIWQECTSNAKESYDQFYSGQLNNILPGFGSDKIISEVEKGHTIADVWNINAYATYESDGVGQLSSGVCSSNSCEDHSRWRDSFM